MEVTNMSTKTKDKGAVLGFEAIIDYPQKGETVMPGHYAIRVSGTPETEVEVRVNGGEWHSCRAGAGFYWLDWWAEPGDLRLVARFKAADNEWKESKERKVKVENPGQN